MIEHWVGARIALVVLCASVHSQNVTCKLIETNHKSQTMHVHRLTMRYSSTAAPAKVSRMRQTDRLCWSSITLVNRIHGAIVKCQNMECMCLFGPSKEKDGMKQPSSYRDIKCVRTLCITAPELCRKWPTHIEKRIILTCIHIPIMVNKCTKVSLIVM